MFLDGPITGHKLAIAPQSWYLWFPFNWLIDRTSLLQAVAFARSFTQVSHSFSFGCFDGNWPGHFLHSHEGYCRQCEDIVARDAAASQRVPSPNSAPRPPGSPDVVFFASNEVIRVSASALEEMWRPAYDARLERSITCTMWCWIGLSLYELSPAQSEEGCVWVWYDMVVYAILAWVAEIMVKIGGVPQHIADGWCIAKYCPLRYGRMTTFWYPRYSYGSEALKWTCFKFNLKISKDLELVLAPPFCRAAFSLDMSSTRFMRVHSYWK